MLSDEKQTGRRKISLNYVGGLHWPVDQLVKSQPGQNTLRLRKKFLFSGQAAFYGQSPTGRLA